MDEIFKFLFKIAIDDPLLIIKKLFQMVRFINIMFISVWIYKYFYGNFIIVKDVQELFDFFITGFFIKPAIILISVILIFDNSLFVLVERFFGILLIDRQVKTFNKIDSFLMDKKNEEKGIVIKRLFRKGTNKMFGKIFKVEDFKFHYDSIAKVNIEKFNIVCLVLTQIIIILIMYTKINVWYLIIPLALFLVELSKFVFIVAKRVCKIVIT